MAETNFITPLTWKRIAVTAALIISAAALRSWPLGSLESTLAWLTFYPAVMIVSIYGGLWSGLLATSLACLMTTVFWPLVVTQPFIKNQADWLGLAIFVLTGTMISGVSEAMRRANRKAVEAQLAAQNANLAKSAFLANMSHELRTPLNSILGYSQLLQRDASLSSEHRGYLTTINRSGEHLLGLINEVLEISKIEANRTTVERENIDIHALILEVKNMFELKTRAKGVDFEIQGIGGLPRYIVTDETKLRIILINLIGNAVKFTENGGVTISFWMEHTSLHEVFLIAEIQDTGSGIADEEHEKLFKYFVQTESGKRTKSGTGLGLAISQSYAALLGGEITVESRLGFGSTFRLRLKTDEGSDEHIRASADHREVVGLAAGQYIPRILVAEDTDDSRLLLVKLLKIIGLDVREVVNGREAVEVSLAWHPDLIWMDIRMPVMDGLEATRMIKAALQEKQPVIVALSAHVLGDERQEIIAAGCDDFIGKPYKMYELFDIMEKHLSLQYRYTEKTTEDFSVKSFPATPMDLRSLNARLLFDLGRASANTDAGQIFEIAEHIKNDDPALSLALHTCAQNFDYETIRTALCNNVKAGRQS